MRVYVGVCSAADAAGGATGGRKARGDALGALRCGARGEGERGREA